MSINEIAEIVKQIAVSMNGTVTVVETIGMAEIQMEVETLVLRGLPNMVRRLAIAEYAQTICAYPTDHDSMIFSVVL